MLLGTVLILVSDSVHTRPGGEVVDKILEGSHDVWLLGGVWGITILILILLLVVALLLFLLLFLLLGLVRGRIGFDKARYDTTHLPTEKGVSNQAVSASGCWAWRER